MFPCRLPSFLCSGRLALLSCVLLAPAASVRAQPAPVAPLAAAQEPTGEHQFVFKADKTLKAVSVVGSFNNWNKTAHPMTVDADGVTWRLRLPLKFGRYVYKFVLFGPGDEETWVVDPKAPLDETDKVNDNSVVMVTPSDYDVPARSDDGKIAASALLHRNGVRDVSYDEKQITLSLRARPSDLRQVQIKSAGQRFPMRLSATDDLYAYYTGKLPWNRSSDLAYSFELTDGERVQEFGADGLAERSRPFSIVAATFQPYLLTAAPEPLKMDGPLTTERVAGPSWAENEPVYEVNLDAYGFERGTALREYQKHLPILKEMGVGLIWFMPLHPRGQKKGFGSPYAVRDYTEINPDLGTKEDFRRLVNEAHRLGLRVLMDWVPNHTAWDNPMIEAHPEFYAKNERGEIVQAGPWPDVAQLDYGQPNRWNQPLWNQMRDDMTFWVREFDVDGFRCDVAGRGGQVPIEFWNWLRPQLEAVKPVFMLAEGDDAYLHPAFDMTYSWNLPPVLWNVSAGRQPATAIDEQLRKEAITYPIGAVRMRFLDNHDWHSHADWGWGDGPPVDTKGGLVQVAPLMVLCATLPGKPLLYNGQEMSFLKVSPSAVAEARYQSPVWPFYRRLMELYQTQPAVVRGRFSKLVSNRDDKIYAFTRQHEGERVLVVVNLSDQPQSVTLEAPTLKGRYRDWFNNADVTLGDAPSLDLEPWAYRVYTGRVGSTG